MFLAPYLVGMMLFFFFTLMVVMSDDRINSRDSTSRVVAISVLWPFVAIGFFIWALWTGSKFLMKIFVNELKN